MSPNSADFQRPISNKTVLTDGKIPPAPEFQPKAIRDSDPNCRINTDADVCQISVQKCCGFHILSESDISPSLVKIGSDCMRNANKSPMFRNGEENQKLIWNMYLGL